jgi:lipopolysaccharide transport system permease protein
MNSLKTAQKSGHNIHRITSHVNPLFFPDLWRWRYLVFLFVKRDFLIYFQQTILGPLWYIFQPLATTTVLMIVFGKIVKLSTDSIPPFLFYFLGSVVWGYFSDCFTRISRSLISNSQELGNAAFPRLTIPVASMFSSLIQFTIQFVLFLILYIWYMQRIPDLSVNLLLLLPAFFQLALISMGGGILVAALTSKYRDLTHLVGFCMQLLYLCTPLIYPLSLVKSPFRHLYGYNPLTSVIELCRQAFFGISSLTSVDILIGWIITLSIVIIGIVTFNIVEKTFIDTV